jgi:hypothetical protein
MSIYYPSKEYDSYGNPTIYYYLNHIESVYGDYGIQKIKDAELKKAESGKKLDKIDAINIYDLLNRDRDIAKQFGLNYEDFIKMSDSEKKRFIDVYNKCLNSFKLSQDKYFLPGERDQLYNECMTIKEKLVEEYSKNKLEDEVNDISSKLSNFFESIEQYQEFVRGINIDPNTLPEEVDDNDFIAKLMTDYFTLNCIFLEKLSVLDLFFSLNYTDNPNDPSHIQLYACPENSIFVFMITGLFKTKYPYFVIDNVDNKQLFIEQFLDFFRGKDNYEIMRGIIYWYKILMELYEYEKELEKNSVNKSMNGILFVYKLINSYGFSIELNKTKTFKNLDYLYNLYKSQDSFNKNNDSLTFEELLLNFLKLFKKPNDASNLRDELYNKTYIKLFINAIEQIRNYNYCNMTNDFIIDNRIIFSDKINVDFFHKINGFTNKLNCRDFHQICKLFSLMFLVYLYLCSKILTFFIVKEGITEDIKIVIDSFPDGLWKPFSECFNIPRNVDELVMRYRSDFKYSNSKTIPKSLQGISANISYSYKKNRSTKSKNISTYEGGRGFKNYTRKKIRRNTRKRLNRRGYKK